MQVGGTLIATGDVDNKILFTLRDNVANSLANQYSLLKTAQAGLMQQFRINYSKCDS